MIRRTHFARLTIGLVSLTLLSGCGSSQQSKVTFRMGERMRVGPFTYNVLESQWKAQLGELLSQRVPEQRFLLIRLSVTNSGGKEEHIPLLSVENSAGQSFQELQDGTGVNGWLGLIRTIQPAQTEEGWIAFDVAPNTYNLRVTGTGGGDEEQSLLIRIPFSIDAMSDGLPKMDK